jgi:hypothetical protein
VDRAGLEKLLQVSPRQALRIMHRLSPHVAGHSLLIPREELIERLESIGADPATEAEHRRQAHLADTLRRTRAVQTARRVEIPVAARQPPHSLDALPEGIRLSPGRLEIAFENGEDLLGKLFTLAQTVAGDLDRFYAAVGEPEPESSSSPETA